MALIACPDCRQPVSDAAPACPKCGCPIADNFIRTSDETTVTTQQTAKRYKGLMVVGASCFWIGILAVFGGAATGGVVLTAIGIFLYIGARFSAWWNNG